MDSIKWKSLCSSLCLAGILALPVQAGTQSCSDELLIGKLNPIDPCTVKALVSAVSGSVSGSNGEWPAANGSPNVALREEAGRVIRVSEPGAGVLCLLGLGALMAVRRKVSVTK